ncbi:MAG: hypothetical protein HCA25_24730 [Dolichospermum sp. DET50]|nr:hypothetical protein [Dolichospermum sp. DET66]MBS3035355.1 hypothetical protein [Dolichospermum sp. DET67]MBS3040557.1 hypothetical protein [Dolichospermum sp. DET50]QSX67692.1 MAG: hypothetical protein EZY12_24000 [Dolichospermum sp. DET69]
MKDIFFDAFKIIRNSLTSPLENSIITRSNSDTGRTLYSRGSYESSELDTENRRLKNEITISPMFKLGFWAALVLTSASLVLSFFLLPKDAQTILSEQQKQLFETCNTTWKMGFGAIIGLIGGKAT